MSAFLTLLALAFEAVFGYPRFLARSIGHPVAWIGKLITLLDDVLNRDDADGATKRRNGIFALVILLAIVGSIAVIVELGLSLLPFGIVLVALLASTFVAQRSLYEHVARVADALEQGDLADARSAVSAIVGRDTEQLDASGIARAAIESLAENFSDGVVAPALWMVVAGLPGAAVYKAINTADSMIGHRSERYEDFGWAAARLDDLVNLPASRLAALLLIGAAGLSSDASPGHGFAAVRRDAARHRSPNAGYPEAAMAGALDLALGGPRHYDGAPVDGAWMGDGRADAAPMDIRAALALYKRADAILIAVVAVIALLIWRM